MPDYQYSYAALLVQGCCTFGARMLHFYWHYYSKVFTVAFLAVVEPRFFCNTILNSIIGFPSGRRTLFLNRRSRQFFIGFPFGRRTLFLHSSFKLLHGALWACGYRAWIKKRSRNITDFFRSLLTDPFFDFFFLIYIMIVPWRDKWDFSRIRLLILSAY